MKYLKYYRTRRKRIKPDEEEFLLDRNFESSLKVIRNFKNYRAFEILDKDERIIEVGENGLFKYYGKLLKGSKGLGWVYKEYEKGELKLSSDRKVFLNGKLIKDILIFGFNLFKYPIRLSIIFNFFLTMQRLFILNKNKAIKEINNEISSKGCS